MIDFNECIPFNLKVGEKFTPVDAPSWDCIAPCIIIGVTDSGVPVLQIAGGPKVNDQYALIPSGTLRTPGKPGMVRAEVLALGQYKKILIRNAEGKLIAMAHHSDSSVIFMFTDNTYVKVVGELCFENEVEIGTPDLTMWDLMEMDLISMATTNEYKQQQDDLQEEHTGLCGQNYLRQAVVCLGINRAAAILNGQLQQG
jgi:hypothetical protein